MQKFFTIVLGAVVFLTILPIVVVKLAPTPDSNPPSLDEETINLYIHEEDKVVEVPFSQYLAGVLAAEMPAAFEIEALKAQATAARTYFYYRQMQGKEVEGHPEGAHICNWPEHGQAWISDDEMKARWGKINYKIYKRKLREAVNETHGQIISYGGQLINPLYHASCGGLGTEASKEVWGGDLPYLVNRPCPRNEDPKPERTYKFSWQQLREALSLPNSVPVSSLQGSKAIEVREYSQGGRIKEINIGGKVLPGSDIRKKLGLASTAFSWKTSKKGIEITTVGHGHGVGMCQRGAQGLALEGYDYTEILKHYYLGVELEKKESK